MIAMNRVGKMQKATATILFMVFSVVLLASFDAQASGSKRNSLSERFKEATVKSGPGTYEALGRTTHSGGYVRTRFEVKSAPQPIKIQGPGISGGCNGFDLYGGSFSYISSEEIIEWLRAVAENGGSLATYMFLTLLQEACSVCSEIMQTLYAMQDLINSTMGGSCDVATAMVTGLASGGESPEWEEYKKGITDSAARVSQHAGATKDALSSKKKAQEDPLDAAESANGPNTEETAREIHHGNLLYWVIDANGTDRFLSTMKPTAGNDVTKAELYTYLSAYAGNMIRYLGEDAEPIVQDTSPIISIQDILNHDYQERAITAGKCGSAFTSRADFCFEPDDTTFCHYLGRERCSPTDMTSFKDHFSCLMNGTNSDGTDCGKLGLIQTLGSIDPENPDLVEGTDLMVFLTSTLPGDTGPLIHKLKRWQTDSGVMNDFFQCNKTRLEIGFARSQVVHALESIEKSLGTASLKDVPKEFVKLYRDHIKARLREVDNEFRQLTKDLDDDLCTKYKTNSAYDATIEKSR